MWPDRTNIQWSILFVPKQSVKYSKTVNKEREIGSKVISFSTIYERLLSSNNNFYFKWLKTSLVKPEVCISSREQNVWSLYTFEKVISKWIIRKNFPSRRQFNKVMMKQWNFEVSTMIDVFASRTNEINLTKLMKMSQNSALIEEHFKNLIKLSSVTF